MGIFFMGSEGLAVTGLRGGALSGATLGVDITSRDGGPSSGVLLGVDILDGKLARGVSSG